MAQPRHTPIDVRLLTHHPAGKRCVEVCTANGWLPESGDVVRLVRLWSEVHDGERSEIVLSRTRLAFARWLVERGRLTEGERTGEHGAAA